MISYFLLAVIALFIRKIFLENLPIELLGYEGLFGNVFALLSLTDLGIEALILYRMFPAFAKDDKNEINKLMSVYKFLYRFVSGGILAFGILLIPFLKHIVSGNSLNWKYVYGIYGVQLIITLCTYFLAYKRLMFVVSQREYECTKVDTIVSLLFNLLKVIVLIVFKSYLLYLFCNLGTNIVSNIIISKRVEKNFEYFDCNQKVSLENIRALGLGYDLKNNVVQKVCGTIYGGTDNIVISMFLGIGQVGLLSNYSLLQSYVTNFMTKMLKPFQASIGNYIYSNDKEKGYEMFRMFDYISFLMASVISICYFILFNPFITLWLGENYLFDMVFVMAFAVNQYILWNHQFVCYYRYSFGKYELDKVPIFLAAFLNVVLSILLCKPLGTAGVMIGTVIGHLGMWFGRVRVVYTEYINESVVEYIKRQIARLVLWAAELAVVYGLCNGIAISPLGIVLRLIICILVPTCINFLLFIKTLEMKNIISYGKKVMDVIKGIQ